MRRFLTYIGILLAWCSCAKEELYLEERRLSTDQLFDVYLSSALFSNAEDEGGKVTLQFSDGSSVSLDRSVTSIVNCLERALPEVSVRHGWWYVDGADAGVAETPGAGDKLSRLVCVAFDFNNVYIHLSNGSELRISSHPLGALWRFDFPAAKNPSLAQDVSCTIQGKQISARVSPGVLAGNLCPVFSFRGVSLHVDGALQRNGVSSHSFAGKVRYVLTGYDNSTTTYEVMLEEDYPTIYIDYTADRIHRTSYIDARMRIHDPARKYWNTVDFEMPIQIKGRGNSTWGFPKKPYHIKLAEKAGIFGMHKNRDWVLLANYSDKSLLRNQVGQMLARIVGMSWAPKSFNVDLYINGDYQGSYDFTEHKEVASDRVNIDVEAGDCYLEIEAQKDNPVCFDTKRMKIPIMFNDPEQPSEELQDEVEHYLNEFEDILVSSRFDDPVWGYEAYIDVESFAKNFIVQELTKNIDADLFKSLFLVKRKGGKLEFYHVWDFDLALGNCNYLNGHAQVTTGPKGWYIMNHSQEGIDTGWYSYLFRGPRFKAVVKRIWQESYPEFLQVPGYIEELYAGIAGSAGRNFTRWPILDTYVWPNIVWLGDYRLELEYMKNFYSERLAWMNGEIEKW